MKNQKGKGITAHHQQIITEQEKTIPWRQAVQRISRLFDGRPYKKIPCLNCINIHEECKYCLCDSKLSNFISHIIACLCIFLLKIFFKKIVTIFPSASLSLFPLFSIWKIQVLLINSKKIKNFKIKKLTNLKMEN